MNTVKLITALLGLLICLPISFYLQYKILKMVGATELMWFLFWIYVPLTILFRAIIEMIDHLEKGK